MQTQWAKGWTFGAIGFQEAASYLTLNRRDFGATIDQVGLVVFFLQRHRMELAMKEVLVADGQLPRGHSLKWLWGAVKKLVGPTSDTWAQFDKDGSELVALIHDRDPDSTRFRYASGLDGKVSRRPAYISLPALDEHVTAFVGMLQGYLDDWDLYADERAVET
ncbi:MAG: hypothetical protein QOI89_2720 [Solirubrobacteraceae bacterium]|nr:hypothetical protein [Solirubrobacteraceae bacterium]